MGLTNVTSSLKVTVNSVPEGCGGSCPDRPSETISGTVLSNLRVTCSDAVFSFVPSVAAPAGTCTVTSPSAEGSTANVKVRAEPAGDRPEAVPPVTLMPDTPPLPKDTGSLKSAVNVTSAVLVRSGENVERVTVGEAPRSIQMIAAEFVSPEAYSTVPAGIDTSRS